MKFLGDEKNVEQIHGIVQKFEFPLRKQWNSIRIVLEKSMKFRDNSNCVREINEIPRQLELRWIKQ